MSELSDLFLHVLRTSRDASVLALIVVVVLAIGRQRLPSQWRYGLLLLVVVRLILPILPSSPVSIQRIVEVASPVSIERNLPEQLVTESLDSDSFEGSPEVPAISKDFETIKVVGNLERPPVGVAGIENENIAALGFWERLSLFEVAAIAWLAVLLSYLLWIAIGWIRFSRRLKRDRERSRQMPKYESLFLLVRALSEEWKLRSPELVITSMVSSPALTGIFRPVILIPESIARGLDKDSMRLVIMHELAHLKRRDVWVQCLLCLLQAVHWFNPILWWIFRMIRVEAERATDELLLRKSQASEEERKRYGHLLLTLLEGAGSHRRLSPGMVGVVESKRDLKRRIKAIKGFRLRTSVLTMVLASAVLLVVGAVGLTQSPDVEPEGAVSEPDPVVSEDLEEDPVEDTGSGPTWDITIVDEDDVLFEGATVYLASRSHGKDPIIQTGRSDVNGMASFSLPEVEMESHEFIAVTDDGMVGFSGAVHVRGIELDRSKSPFEHPIKLEKGLEARVRFVDLEGNAIPDLLVEATELHTHEIDAVAMWVDVSGLPKGVFSAVTNRDGECVIPNLPRERYVTTDHEDLRYAMPHGRQDPMGYGVQSGNDRFKLIVLENSCSISGRIVLPDGTPVSSTRVAVQEMHEWKVGGATAYVFTDDQGYFMADSLPSTKYALKVDLPEYLKKDWAEPTLSDLVPTSGEDVVLPDIVLAKGGLIEGRFVYSDSEERTIEAGVSVVSMGQGRAFIQRWDTNSNESGRYLIRIPPGIVTVSGGVSSEKEFFIPRELDSQAIIVEEGSHHEIDFILQKKSFVTGSVVDSRGSPVEGATIVCVEPTLSLGPASTSSDADGTFSLALESGEPPFRLIAWKGTAALEGTASFDSKENVELVLLDDQLFAIEGRIVDSEDRPIPGVRVDVGDTFELLKVGAPVVKTGEILMTDDQGRYKSSVLLPNFWGDDESKVTVKVSKDGFLVQRLSHPREKLRNGEPFPDMVLDEGTGTVSGTVIYKNGKPANGALINVLAVGVEELYTHSNRKGEFELSGLPDDEVILIAHQSGGNLAARVETVVGNSGVVMRLLEKPIQSRILGGVPFPELRIESWVGEAFDPSQPKRRLYLFCGKDRSIEFFKGQLRRLAEFQEAHQGEIECVLIHGGRSEQDVLAELKQAAPKLKLPIGIEPLADPVSDRLGITGQAFVLVDADGEIERNEQWLGPIERYLKEEE